MGILVCPSAVQKEYNYSPFDSVLTSFTYRRYLTPNLSMSDQEVGGLAEWWRVHSARDETVLRYPGRIKSLSVSKKETHGRRSWILVF